MNTDLTFILRLGSGQATNEPPTFAKALAGKEANLLNRFKVLIKAAGFLTVLENGDARF